MRALALAALAWLAGCAILPRDTGEATAVSEIVGETVGAVRAPAPEQRTLLAAAQRRFADSPSDSNRVRLAALYASLPEPLRDDTRARGLLDPLAASGSRSAMAQLAALLADQVSARQRLASDRARAQRAAELREDALRQQIEALTAIERGILDREERLRARER